MSSPRLPLRSQGARHMGRAVGVLNWLCYPAAVWLSGSASLLGTEHPDVVKLQLLVGLIVGAPRYFTGRKLTVAPEEQLARLVNLYMLCVYLVALHWAAFCWWGEVEYRGQFPSLLLVMVTSGLVAASTTGLNAHLPTQVGYILIMSGVPAVGLASYGNSQDRFTALFALMFLVFMTRAAVVNHRQFVDWLLANRALSEALEQEQILEERWSLAFDGSGDGVWDYSRAEGKVYFSPRFRDMTGLDDDAHQFTDWFARFDEQDREAAVEAVERLLREPAAVLNHECRMRQGDGSLLWTMLRGKVVARSASGEPLRAVGTCSDIDEQKQLQIQLNLSRNLECVGELAAGIAHEINTPVQYISDNVNFLGEALEELVASVETGTEPGDFAYLRQEVPLCLDQTLGGLRHIATIVSAMREFTHRGQGDLSPTNLNHLLENSLTLCQNRLKYVAVVERQLDERLPELLANQSELSQVFLNLLINASDAVLERFGGEQDSDGHISVMTSCQGDRLEVQVSDNGCGIPGPHQTRVFEPFFTTKAVGKGTGQGLTLCRSIVRRYGGEIAFRSEPGRGTTFSVTFPLKRAG